MSLLEIVLGNHVERRNPSSPSYPIGELPLSVARTSDGLLLQPQANIDSIMERMNRENILLGLVPHQILDNCTSIEDVVGVMTDDSFRISQINGTLPLETDSALIAKKLHGGYPSLGEDIFRAQTSPNERDLNPVVVERVMPIEQLGSKQTNGSPSKPFRLPSENEADAVIVTKDLKKPVFGKNVGVLPTIPYEGLGENTTMTVHRDPNKWVLSLSTQGLIERYSRLYRPTHARIYTPDEYKSYTWVNRPPIRFQHEEIMDGNRRVMNVDGKLEIPTSMACYIDILNGGETDNPRRFYRLFVDNSGTIVLHTGPDLDGSVSPTGQGKIYGAGQEWNQAQTELRKRLSTKNPTEEVTNNWKKPKLTPEESRALERAALGQSRNGPIIP